MKRLTNGTGDGRQIDLTDEDDKWVRAPLAFEMLNNKIAAAPVLRHFDPDRTPVVVVYASDWAISAALMHVHDGVYMPVNFTSRMLKSNALNYGAGEKGVLARVLHAVGHEVGQGIDSTLDLGMAGAIIRPAR
ncbi:hypothetical protein PI125_g18555 [Phytophthora idaei]|nr:hypothetical protein PI125_g18555 [Phytophthora idaei]KAG3142825.1 hypothetical protein PI126_g14885 [Phytophthora idaei]